MDIHCRVCGEPYSCVGGLHFSHTDLAWWQFDQFIRGLGCPCCGGDRPKDENPVSREELDRQWMCALAHATDEVTPFADFETVAAAPVQFSRYIMTEPSIEKRLYEGTEEQYVALQKLDRTGEHGKCLLHENLDDRGRSWSIEVNPDLVSDPVGRSSVKVKANFKAFTNLTEKHKVDFDEDRNGEIYIKVVHEDTRTKKLSVVQPAVALLVELSAFEPGSVLDGALYEEMCEEAYAELEDEKRTEIAEDFTQIFDCSVGMAERYLKAIDNLFERVDFNDELSVDLTVELDKLKIGFAREHGLTGWLFVKTRKEYGDTYAVIGGVTATYRQPEGQDTFHAVASYRADGENLGAGDYLFEEFSISKTHSTVFNGVRVRDLPDDVVLAFLKDLKDEL